MVAWCLDAHVGDLTTAVAAVGSRGSRRLPAHLRRGFRLRSDAPTVQLAAVDSLIEGRRPRRASIRPSHVDTFSGRSCCSVRRSADGLETADSTATHVAHVRRTTSIDHVWHRSQREPATGVGLSAARAHRHRTCGFDVVETPHLCLPRVPSDAAPKRLAHDSERYRHTRKPRTVPEQPVRASHPALGPGGSRSWPFDGCSLRVRRTGVLE